MEATYVDELSVAVKAARRAGNFLRLALGSVSMKDIAFKGENEIVTFHDLEAQRMILEDLSTSFPDHSFLTEENADTSGNSVSNRRWIIDPLDGTSNYARGFPHFCVSLALEISGQVQLGVVYSPQFDELFHAVRGAGAFRNGQPVRVSSTSRLSDALVGTGFPYKQANLAGCLQLLGRISSEIRSPRVVGAAALDICYVACGRLDGYWDVELSPWDMSAGSLIVDEAGGRVTTVKGEPFDHLGQTLIVSNGILHSAIQEALWKDEVLQ